LYRLRYFDACCCAVTLGCPMVVAMLTRIQSWILTAAAALLALIGVYASGSRAARRAEELKQARSRVETTRKAHDVKQEMDALSDDAVRVRASRWVRGEQR